MKTSPRIYLVLDNVFAIKRWVRPMDWLGIAKDLGFSYVQASTDNEIDPLFSTSGHMDDWFSEVEKWQDKTGVRVVNFYTGYQTYRTVGLAHYNIAMAERLKNDWAFALIKRIAKLGAVGMGFCLHAIPENVMQDSAQYYAMEERIIRILSEIGDYAWDHNHVQAGYEQMYVPYQTPFTIAQCEDYLKRCYAPKNHPTYITLDTGHMTGQAKFLKPTREQIIESFSCGLPNIWLGSDALYAEWERHRGSLDYEGGADAILKGMEEYPYFFSSGEDTDVYAWFEKLAKYSPIVHMQQTDGQKSSHLSFTSENNAKGVINGEKLFAAIKKSYGDANEIQPPASDIYLSFELFFANTADKRSIMRELSESLEYWRRFVPRDGMTLDEIMENI